MTRDDLPELVERSLRRLGGAAPISRVAEDIWKNHEAELKASGDLFFTWQYDMRWAAQRLRDRHKLAYGKRGSLRIWELL